MSKASELHLKSKDPSYDTTRELAIDREPPQAQMLAKRADLTPMTMLDRAIASGAGVDVLEKLVGLQERWEANQNRRAYNAAIAAARAEMPVILKNREVDFTTSKGRTNYVYEDLAEIARTVDPILARHGLSYRWRTVSAGDDVTVTCVISHGAGHSEENSLSGKRDETGNKNPLQGIGSTVTFLQRYTLKSGLGLAAAKDDDGAAAGGGAEFVTEEQAKELEALCGQAGAKAATFLEWLRAENFAHIAARHYERAKKELNDKIAATAAKANQ